MDTFTASTGVAVTPTASGTLRVHLNPSGGRVVLGPEEYEFPEIVSTALREFFQAENDERLGRWRDPERPHMVVYPADEDDMIRVVDEATARNAGYYADDLPLPPGARPMPGFEDHRAAFLAYRAAHPARPAWADAEVISWPTRDGHMPNIAQRDLDPGDDLDWYSQDVGGVSGWFTVSDLAKEIGDAEVTVLVPATKAGE